MPNRTPRMPNMGLYSPIDSTRCVTVDRGKSNASARFSKPARSVGKNSCKGGSNRRMHTGNPRMIRNNSMKSARCIGNKRSKTERRSCAASAKIISRITVNRSTSKNMCSVRHSPMPCASKLRAVCASRGVSAFARTRISQFSAAHFMKV